MINNKNYSNYFSYEDRYEEIDNYLGYIQINVDQLFVIGCCKLPQDGKVTIFTPSYINSEQIIPLFAYAEKNSILGSPLRIKHVPPGYYSLTLSDMENLPCFYLPTEMPDELITYSSVIDKTFIKGLLKLIDDNPLLKTKKSYSKFYNHFKHLC